MGLPPSARAARRERRSPLARTFLTSPLPPSLPPFQVTVYPVPKGRAEAFGLARKAVPSFTVKGPATVRDVVKSIHETLKGGITGKQLRSFPKEKVEEIKEGAWMDLLGDQIVFDGFVEELAGSGEIDVRYTTVGK